MKRLCQVLEVARSSFYKWRAGRQARAARERADAALAERIRAVHAEWDGTYGRPRITAELRGEGERVNHKRVGRVMRKYGIAGLRLRKRQVTTVPEPSFTVAFTRYVPATRACVLASKSPASFALCSAASSSFAPPGSSTSS